MVVFAFFFPRKNEVEISLIKSVREDASRFAASKIIQKLQIILTFHVLSPLALWLLQKFCLLIHYEPKLSK